MEISFEDGFLAASRQEDNPDNSTARDAEKTPSRLQRPKPFIDDEMERQAPSAPTPSEDRASNVCYRGFRPQVRKTKVLSKSEEPSCVAPKHSILDGAIAVFNKEGIPISGAAAVACHERDVAEGVAVSAADERATINRETVAVANDSTQQGIKATVEVEPREAAVEATQHVTSTRNKSRFRMPRLFADTEEIGADELKAALEQASTPAAKKTVAPASAPAQTADDGITYTYYRGVKTAVHRPGAQPNPTQISAPPVTATASQAATASPSVSPARAVPAPVIPRQSVTSPQGAPAMATPMPVSSQTVSPSPESALLHEMERLRAGMLDMSLRLQEMQEMQQQSEQRGDNAKA
jgi:hypothetical protein